MEIYEDTESYKSHESETLYEECDVVHAKNMFHKRTRHQLLHKEATPVVPIISNNASISAAIYSYELLLKAVVQLKRKNLIRNYRVLIYSGSRSHFIIEEMTKQLTLSREQIALRDVPMTVCAEVSNTTCNFVVRLEYLVGSNSNGGQEPLMWLPYEATGDACAYETY
uniref:Uncharacterized protein n=1 Tax=Vespula pensylvanica TaxID=30213 RepID=A0A834NWY2_VESPE|nr:hypothetical protein H0235_010385 [Vespula pensylvanica]